MNKYLKYLLIFLVSIFLLILIVFFLIRIPKVQTYLVNKASKSLSNSFETDIKVNSVSIDLFSNIVLNDILIRDYKNDTMVYVNELKDHHSIINARQIGVDVSDISVKGVKFYINNTIEDDRLNLSRTFTSMNKDKSKKSNNSKSTSDVDLRLKDISIEDIHFIYDDNAGYQKFDVKVDNIAISSDGFSPFDSVLDLSSVEINKPDFLLVKKKSPNTPTDYTPKVLKIPLNTNIEKFQIQKGEFTLVDKNKNFIARKGEILFSDIKATRINIQSKNVILNQDFIKAQVENVSVREKSGLEVVALRSNFFFSSNKTEARNLYFKTKNSELNGHLKFQYSNLKKYLRFAEWVNVSTNGLRGNLNLKDIEHFVPNLKNFAHLDIKFNTRGQGRMNELKLNNVKAHINDVALEGNLNIKDMFRSGGVNFVFDIAKSSFAKKDAEFIFRKELNIKGFDKLGRINYVGLYDGNFQKFTLNGNVNTDYGNAVLTNLDLNITNPDNVRYKGNVELRDVEFSDIFDFSYQIDDLNLKTDIDGSGLVLAELNSMVKGDVYSIVLDSQIYRNIALNGVFDNKNFTGKIISKDKDLDFIANGKIRAQGDEAILNMNCKVNNVSLNKLNVSDKNLYIKGDFNLIGSGKNVDEFIGGLRGERILLTEKQQNRVIKNKISDIQFSHTEQRGNHKYKIQSDEISGDIEGSVLLSQLPRIFKNYLIRYLTVGNADQSEKLDNDFKLNLKLNNIENYTKIFYPDLKNIEKGSIKSEYSHNTDLFTLNAKLKNTYWNNFYVPNINVSNQSSLSKFQLQGVVDSLFVNNVLGVTPINVNAKQVSEGLKLTVELLEKDNPKFVDVNALINKNSEYLNMKILPFSSYFGRKVWNIDKDNTIKYNFSDKQVFVSNLNLNKDAELVSVNSDLQQKNKLNIDLKDVQLEELISGFLPNLDILHGQINGKVEIVNVLSKPRPISNLTLTNFKVKDVPFCDLSFQSSINKDVINSTVIGYGGKVDFVAKSKFDLEKDYLDSDIDIGAIDMSLGNIVLSGLLDELGGELSGKLKLKGELSKLSHTGSLYATNVRMMPSVTKVRYYIKNEKIDIEDSKILINDITLKDPMGNTASVSGSITHNNFKDFNLNVDASSDKLLCLNTDVNTNKNFYGKVIAKANANFSGIIGNVIKIRAKGDNLPLSKVNIAFSSLHQTEKYSFYEFAKKEASKDTIIKQRYVNKGVELELDFNVNSDGRLSIIMDPDSKDRIDCRGDGKIAFRLTPEDEMTLKGTYEIKSGTYLFTYQDILQRTFYLNSGGKMTFIGDPYASLIDASATFKARANAQDIVTAYYGNNTSSTITSAAKNTVKVNVLLNLNGNIIAPDISYNFDIEQNNPTLQNAFESIKTITENNENELNKQVMGILVFRKFFPPSISGFQNAAVNTGDVENTFTSLVTSQLSSYITDWVQHTFKGMNVDLSVKNYSQFNVDQSSTDVRRELKLAFSQQLSDRLIFNFGGNYDFGRDQFQNSNTAFFGGDMDFEFLLNENGRFRLRGYSTLDNDPLNSKYINKTGLGIIYLKNFNTMSSFFKSQKSKNE